MPSPTIATSWPSACSRHDHCGFALGLQPLDIGFDASGRDASLAHQLQVAQRYFIFLSVVFSPGRAKKQPTAEIPFLPLNYIRATSS